MLLEVTGGVFDDQPPGQANEVACGASESLVGILGACDAAQPQRLDNIATTSFLHALLT
jgi:hypothetical protein